ncbi:lysosomal acid glucosylceramidase-like [Papilio machaon]|uniref:lysosomal acid glucosylceramidase-like n=1 Tax=Papilio machaon TaxID=76193 RepID=UPI001E664044|nr:lysosomal acid glucosylceramidase-like [Papilio machaon]
MEVLNIFNIVCVVLLLYAGETIGKRSSKLTRDKECAARFIDGKSVVCVCNETYCDTITRDVPDKGSYISYTSSQGGSRFKKKVGKLLNKRSKKSKYEYELDTDTKYQTIEGFGTAATGSAGYNLNTLPAAAQDNLIRSYFSDEGLEYNMLRVPIGGCDFSLTEYAYNDLPVDDCRLTNYSLTCEDLNYKIPAIKKMMEVSKSPVHIVASTWSPPKWMKYFNERSPNCGFLKTEYFQTYADYHLKFLDEYASRGIPVWAITTTNEPSIASTNIPTTTCLGWTTNQIGKWIVENLGPTIRKSSYKDTKILALDDHRFTIATDFYDIIRDHPKVLDYIDGLALHWYYDNDVPVQTLQKFQQNYPYLFTLSTEACEGYQSYAKNKVDLGSWERAENYIKDIIQNLNNNVVGWLDWNFCLDTNGGPNCMNNFVDSPIIVNSEKREFVKQPMFYAMGHFSKFIPRGSRRIGVKANCSPKCIDEAAFITPQNTIVFVVYNDSSKATRISVKVGEREIPLMLEAKSITTVEFNNEDCKCKSNTTSITVYASSNPVVLKLKAARISIQI